MKKSVRFVRPYPKQQAFLRAKTARIAYGGARGGGAVLTNEGRDLLTRYRAFEKAGKQALLDLAAQYFEGV